MSDNTLPSTPEEKARFIRARLPEGGLFTGHEWRISPSPLPLGEELVKELEGLGRLLLQFYRAVNLLHRQSLAGKQPAWAAAWLDAGKPRELLDVQESPALKNEVPRVIRPDVILTEAGPIIAELDSVPGGIGLTAWLNQAYSALPGGPPVIGGPDGMIQGFSSVFGDAPAVHIVVSEEAETYRPEMNWLAAQLGERFHVRDARFDQFAKGDAVYRFFELFDLPQVPAAKRMIDMAMAKDIRLTAPPKPVFEEKMLFALLWNRNLRNFWRQELGERFFERMRALAPYSWVVDPNPLPPQGAIPELNLTDWTQLKALSQRERDLILKISGFSEKAWGARGVFLGSDLPTAEWAAAVDTAINSFATSPYVLQRYHHPKMVKAEWYDFAANRVEPMSGRVRLCPYYFVSGDGDAARANLGGILATICPPDKKIIHGMSTAILAPCSV
jgi:hypothetical protein